MENKNIINEIDKRFNTLNEKIATLQDGIHNIKSNFNLFSSSFIKKESLSEITKIIKVNNDNYLDKRPSSCQLKDLCTTIIEKKVFEVIMTFMKDGDKRALESINTFVEGIKSSSEFIDHCSDGNCAENAIYIFNSLAELIESASLKQKQYLKTLLLIDSEIDIAESNEKELCKMITPISNEARIKILKVLCKNGLYYSQIEREVGIKGGHFHFHLEKLIEAGYIEQEREKGIYSITVKGLKILRLLYGLNQEIIIPDF